MRKWTEADIKRLQATGIKAKEIAPKGITPTVKEREVCKKYGNIRCEIDNIKFDSTKEGERYKDLKILQLQGYISDLKVHTKWLLVSNPELKYTLSYEDDFNYIEKGLLKVEDVKPQKPNGEYLISAKFKQKRKLLKRLYDLDIILV